MGYPPDYVWRMTPKRLEATLFVARKRRNREMLERLKVAQMAQSSDEQALRKFVKELDQ
jgi:lipase chaperone LimK